MRLILEVLILILFVNIYLLHLFGVSLDGNFIISLLNGLLPNIVVFFVAIFVVDRLIKRVELNKLKLINRYATIEVLLAVNKLIFNILDYLKCTTDKDYKVVADALQLSPDADFFASMIPFAIDKFEDINLKNDWNQVLYKNRVISEDKTIPISFLFDIIRNGCRDINLALTKIYPRHSSEVEKLIQRILKLSDWMENDIRIEESVGYVNLEKGLLSDDNHNFLNRIFVNLIILSRCAVKNQLFAS